jgi:thioredoxin 1
MAVTEATSADFEKEVLQSEQKVLVDFNADWCGPCQMLRPTLEEFAEETKDIKVVSVNIDDEMELAEQYEVVSIPCLVLFEGGKEIKRSFGVLPKSKLRKFVND